MEKYEYEKRKAIILGTMVEAVERWDGTLEHLEYYDMYDDFNELMGDNEPLWITQRVFYGDFNPNHDYFGFDGYGNLVSYDVFDFAQEMLDYEDEILERYNDVYENDEELRLIDLQSLEEQYKEEIK